MPQRRTLDEFVAGVRRQAARQERQAPQSQVILMLRSIEERLTGLEEEVKSLAEEVRGIEETLRSIEGKLREQGQKPQRRTAYDLLREQGFISLSSLRGKVRNPRALVDRLEGMGAIVLELEDDVIVVDPSFYKSFIEELGKISTADEMEAARSLGRYARLFDALRRTGLIYFDHRNKKWVFV